MNNYLQDSSFSSAPYATKAAETRGRLVVEPASVTRTEFQRDRDRIIHSGAFRKLRNKTQVFIENEGDYYRTRLTHSLEVAQIARSIARTLGLNEDLTETVALAHDLGHTCFGHAGEWGLADIMKPFGGFSHNEQTFRILTQLEHRYIQFDGLNLTWETLEGAVKHNGPLLPEKTGKPLPATVATFSKKWDLELASYASAEAQVAALADDIAYNTHDMDDGYRAGFFDLNDLKDLPLFGPALFEVKKEYNKAGDDRVMSEVVRRVIGLMITDVLSSTRANLASLKPKSAVDIRKAQKPIVEFSAILQPQEKAIREFLTNRMYRHDKVKLACSKADQIVKDLFTLLMNKTENMPASWQERLQEQNGEDNIKARIIADYIAGMTDRYAVLEHRRLFATETII